MLNTVPTHPPGRLETVLVWWGRAAVVAVFVTAVANWVGWATGIDRLTQLFPSWPPMSPWSAVLVAALGIAVLVQSERPSRTRVCVGRGMAVAAGVLAVAFLAEHATGGSLGLDQVWFSESLQAKQAYGDGSPSPLTASSVLLLSLAIWLTRLDRRWTPMAWALTLVTATALPVYIVVGYVFESLLLVVVTRTPGMGISTALAIVLLVTATFVARADRNPLAWLLARPDRWTLVRMVGILAVPPVLIGLSRPIFLKLGLRDDTAWVLSISLSTIVVGVVTFYLSQHEHRRLLEAQERIRLIVANAPSAISIRNRKHLYELVNQTFCDFFGVNGQGEALGRTASALLPSDVLAEIRVADTRAMNGETTRFEYEVTLDGKRVTVDAQVFPIDSGQGQITGIGMIGTDITERKRVERQLRDRLDFEDLITAAMNDGRLLVYSQPIVDARTKELVEEELLIRMIDSDGELIAPDRFLPQAQRFGLMPVIDRFMVARGIELARAGRHVAVNLSADSIGDRSTIAGITDQLRHAGEFDGKVSFEITEHDALASLDIAEHFSDEMRLLGCPVALDDFGTGFGTFTELRRITLHSLKIDMSFVRGLLQNKQDESVVKMIIRIANEFGLVTTAEGVTDAETLDRLVELGVDRVQGYLVGVPAPATA
ncbi:hypothetical protein NGTWS1803_02960 [Mycolicibacterium cyprinidarum]|nr:hypothetical protein NGTWS1803_02960 [Mycolicibacterium sp. NGTWS1803]